MLIHLIAAARPNFMKIAPLYHALIKTNWGTPIIVHTGQHYDLNMSDAFFTDLQLPEPHIHLGVGSGSHAEQTGNVMIAYEKILKQDNPDIVVVVGDVNSTMAATLAAVKLGVKVAHLEAGLRSFDRTMPEEINRIVTDSLADILLTPSTDGDENLIREGVDKSKIFRVGNIMIDSLEMLRETIDIQNAYKEYGLSSHGFGLITLHRPANVDYPEKLKRICEVLKKVSIKMHLIFPVHPRTQKNLENFGLMDELKKTDSIILTSPLNYIRFMNMVFNCAFVVTDSGGIQEETTYLGIPCFTLRPNTERPITITQGTNRLCTIDNVEECVLNNLAIPNYTSVPELWDGHTAERVAEVIKNTYKISTTNTNFGCHQNKNQRNAQSKLTA